MPAVPPSIAEQARAATPPAAATTPPAGGAAPPVADSAPAAKPARPDWLGKSFDGYWSDDKGFDAAKFDTDYGALQALKTQADERAKLIPENPDDYEIGLPADFKLPDGVTAKPVNVADDPVLKEVLPDIRKFAKDARLTKDQFKGLVALKARLDLAEASALRTAAKQQMEKLGSKAEQRIQGVVTFMQSKLGNEHANALMGMMFSATQVEAVEKLMALAGGATSAPVGGREVEQPRSGPTPEEWDKMSLSQRIRAGAQLDAERAAKRT